MAAISDSATSPLVERLAAFDVFNVLERSALEDLLMRAHSQYAPRKRMVVSEGEFCQSLGVVLEGRLSVNLALRGLGGSVRPCMLYLVQPGETFLEFAAVDGGEAVGEIVALTDVRYATIPKDDVRAAMRRSPAFADALMSRATSRARHSIRRLATHLTLPMQVRVAQVLLPYAQGAGLQPADPLLVRMTQSQLAAMAGSVKEVFARTIAELEVKGALRREHGHIAYLDSEKLAEFASANGR